MSEPKSLPKEFELVSSNDEANRMIRDAVKSFAAAMLWTKDQSSVLKTQIMQINPDGTILSVHLPKEFDSKKFLKEVLATPDHSCYFSVSLLTANIFFKTRYIGVYDDSIQFQIPEKIYKVQRRKDLRIRIAATHKLKLEFDDPTDPFRRLEKAAFDLSAGGVSFLVSPGEEFAYPIGTALNNLSFSIQSKNIQVLSEVRHNQTIKLHGKNEIKIGLRFVNLKASDSNAIASFVFEESRKYFVRYV